MNPDDPLLDIIAGSTVLLVLIGVTWLLSAMFGGTP